MVVGGETSKEAFDRGEVAGGVAARLARHDDHFERINHSLDSVAEELHSLAMAVQRQGDEARSRDATVLATAAALKNADDARRRAEEGARWPLSRASLIVGILAAAVTVTVTLFFALT